MSGNKQQLAQDMEMNKLFRSFEIISEYRELKYDRRGLSSKLPKILSLFTEYQFLSYYFASVPKWRVVARNLLSKSRIAPDYVMTGPIKNGSSDMASHLLLHPNIMPPLAKEISSLSLKNWRAYYPTENEKKAQESLVGGPVRCGYLEPFLNNMTLMNKLYELNPQSKVIITLRDPVDRAYTQWKWEVFLGGESLRKKIYFQSFKNYVDRAIDLFPSIPMETVCGFPVLQTGIYNKAVEHWINRFGCENVLILDSSEYFTARQPVLERVQKFLELPIVDIPEYGKKANENPIKLPPPDAESKVKLSEFYRPYNNQLFELLGKEFSWQ